MTNGVALPVYVTEILIYCWIEPFPAFLVKLICMYLTVWRSFHHTKLHAYTPSSLIKSNVEGGGGGGGGGEVPLASLWLCYPRPHYSSVTPGLTTSLLPLASLWLCYPWPHYGAVTPGLTIWLCYLWPHYESVTPGTSLWLCYPWPHYGSVTPGLAMALLPLHGLTMALLPLASLLFLCV